MIVLNVAWGTKTCVYNSNSSQYLKKLLFVCYITHFVILCSAFVACVRSCRCALLLCVRSIDRSFIRLFVQEYKKTVGCIRLFDAESLIQSFHVIMGVLGHLLNTN